MTSWKEGEWSCVWLCIPSFYTFIPRILCCNFYLWTHHVLLLGTSSLYFWSKKHNSQLLALNFSFSLFSTFSLPQMVLQWPKAAGAGEAYFHPSTMQLTRCCCLHLPSATCIDTDGPMQVFSFPLINTNWSVWRRKSQQGILHFLCILMIYREKSHIT